MWIFITKRAIDMGIWNAIADTRGAVRRRLGSELFGVIGWIIAVRGAVLAVSLVIAAVWGLAEGAHGYGAILTLWFRWDALHYVTIAEQWYTGLTDQNLIVFFPLYPLLIRLLSVVIEWHVAAWLIAQVAAVAGLTIFYQLARHEFGARVAFWSLLALVWFPTAYFFSAPYSEALYLFLSVATFLAARRGRWAAAGVGGGLAVLTRLVGLALLPALLVELWQQQPGQHRWRAGAWLLLLPAGLALYLLINYQVFSDFFAFTEIQRVHWYKSFSWPWVGMVAAWRWVDWPLSTNGFMLGVAELAAAVLVIGGMVLAGWKLRLSYVVYLAAYSWLILSPSFLMSTPRYLLGAFPFFFLLGQLWRRFPKAGWLALGMSAMLQALFLIQYLRGWWAF